MDFYQGVVFLLAKFDKSSPSVNRDREIVKVTWLWGNDVLEEEYCWGLLLSKFDVSSFSMTGDIYRFPNWSFYYFGQVKIDPSCLFLPTLGMSQLLYWIWARY